MCRYLMANKLIHDQMNTLYNTIRNTYTWVKPSGGDVTTSWASDSDNSFAMYAKSSSHHGAILSVGLV